jgi:hypothetical protein
MKTKVIFLFVTLLCVAMIASCSLPGLSATPDIKNTATAQPTTASPTVIITNTGIVGDLGWGVIHGKVTDAGTGAPIVGAKVTCWHYSYTSPARCNTSILTNQDGEFVFTDIYFHDTDHIQVKVEARGYATQTTDARFFTWPSLTADFALVPAVSVEPPSAVCTQPACGPYEALTCPLGNCTGGCGYICATPAAICTPPACAIGTSEVYYCSSGGCAGGCGTTCATFTPGP